MIPNSTKVAIGTSAMLQAQIEQHKETETFQLYRGDLKAKLTRIVTAVDKFISEQRKREYQVDNVKLSKKVRTKLIKAHKTANLRAEAKRSRGDNEVKDLNNYKDLPADFLQFISVIPAYQIMLTGAIDKSKDIDNDSKRWLQQAVNHLEDYTDIITDEILI